MSEKQDIENKPKDVEVKPKFNRKEYMKNYCRVYNNKKYHEDPAYRNAKKKYAKAKSNYVRKTKECIECGVRNRIHKLYGGRCTDCVTLLDLINIKPEDQPQGGLLIATAQIEIKE